VVPLVFEPVAPIIVPLFTTVTVTPELQPVPVYIAAVLLEEELTVTPAFTVNSTLVAKSPPALVVAELIS
jgi:hypothetical protein